MAESTLELTYDGPALADGRMEVRELAPALLALADLTRDANRIIHGSDAAPVKLEIRARAPGSFVVELALVQDFLSQAVDFLTGDAAAALDRLKGWIAGSAGLFWAIKKIRKRRIESRNPTTTPGMVILTLDDGTTLEMPAQTLQLYDEVTIRRRAGAVIEPLRRDGIDEARFRPDLSSDTTLRLTAEDLPAFEVSAEVEPLLDVETEMVVEVTSPTFEAGNKWRLSDGTRRFAARMEDDSFMERVDTGERFGKGDLLRCRMRIQQDRSETGLATEYKVIEVLQHIIAPQAPPLPLGNGDDGGS